MNGARALYGTSTPAPTPAPPPNRPPTVTASCSPCTIESGQTTTLRATASDPDGDSLTYSWTVPAGAFVTPTTSSTIWNAPLQPVSVTATITVRDSRGASATASVALQVVFRNRLLSGARLLPGQWLTSPNGRYRLLYQPDGNLVLYDDIQRTAPWSTKTGNMTPGFAAMQGDGNFVVYDAQGRDRFKTDTVGNANAHLSVQNDGNVVVYRTNGTSPWDRISAEAAQSSAALFLPRVVTTRSSDSG